MLFSISIYKLEFIINKFLYFCSPPPIFIQRPPIFLEAATAPLIRSSAHKWAAQPTFENTVLQEHGGK